MPTSLMPHPQVLHYSDNISSQKLPPLPTPMYSQTEVCHTYCRLPISNLFPFLVCADLYYLQGSQITQSLPTWRTIAWIFPPSPFLLPSLDHLFTHSPCDSKINAKGGHVLWYKPLLTVAFDDTALQDKRKLLVSHHIL